MKGILFYFYSPMVWFAAFLVLVLLYLIIKRPKGDEEQDSSGKVAITTKDMLHDVNKERREKGLYEVPELNTAAGANTGNLARRDNSFKSVPDFFRQLFSKKKD